MAIGYDDCVNPKDSIPDRLCMLLNLDAIHARKRASAWAGLWEAVAVISASIAAWQALGLVWGLGVGSFLAISTSVMVLQRWRREFDPKVPSDNKAAADAED